MTLGTELGRAQATLTMMGTQLPPPQKGHIVSGGDLAFLQKGHSPHSIFGPCLLWPNGWIDQDAVMLLPVIFATCDDCGDCR